MFKLVSKADLTHIPYKGAGPAIIDTIAGFIPLVTDAITSLKSHLDSGELNETLEDNAVRSRLLTYGATIKYGTPAQATELINSEIEKWAKVVKATGARVD